MGFTARIVWKRVVRPYSKNISEIVLDIRIGKKNKNNNKSMRKGKDTELKRIKERKRMARNLGK